MTLKEELEILRGEPIQVFTGDPLDIPCTETSDPARLCKHPVVSVNMITYNHEPYIRQAIEGVMMQKTDFEFELVIGEDCSTDRTREICFEYQKRYPDKIRVLWCDHNLYRNPHPAGGNGERNMAHCRGEFIAFCEGDDYWIDPLKLQKQVDVMRTHLSVGIVSGKHLHLRLDGNAYTRQDIILPVGLIKKEKAFLWLLYGMNPERSQEQQIHTSTILVRAEVLRQMKELFAELFEWSFYLGDLQIFLGATAISDLYMLKEPISMYRCGGGGLMTFPLSASRVRRDGMLVTIYFTKRILNFDVCDVPTYQIDDLFMTAIRVLYLLESGAKTVQSYWDCIATLPDLRFVKEGHRYERMNRMISEGSLGKVSAYDFWTRIKFFHGAHVSGKLREYYTKTAPAEFQRYYEKSHQTFAHRCLEGVRTLRSYVKYMLQH